MERSRFILAIGLAGVVALFASLPLKAEARDDRDPGATASGLTADCVPDLVLSGNSKALIRYTISCAVRETKVLATLKAGAGQELTRVSRRMVPKGPGALGRPHCRLTGERMTCRAHKTGPVTFKGWLMVKPGTRCRDRFTVSVGDYTHYFYPLGCPGAKRPPLPSVARIQSFRHERGLDLDLTGDNAAIEARAIALRQALRRGDPSALVGRRTWGVPLRDVDLHELEYRLHYLIDGSAALYEWFDRNASETFAGSWIDEAAGGLIYVRFTGDQEAQLAALRSAPGILAPERIVGYGVPALYSMAQLRALASLVRDEAWGPLGLQRLVTRIGIEVKENKVVVGSTDPESVAQALTARFGAEAPIAVVYRRTPVAKPLRKSKAPF